MTAWRSVTREEQRADFRLLIGFLDPRVAAVIASMPAVCQPPVPFSIRADAWLHRTAGMRP